MDKQKWMAKFKEQRERRRARREADEKSTQAPATESSLRESARAVAQRSSKDLVESETWPEPREVHGLLLGLQLVSRTFELQVGDAVYQGRFPVSLLGDARNAALGSGYLCTIRRVHHPLRMEWYELTSIVPATPKQADDLTALYEDIHVACGPDLEEWIATAKACCALVCPGCQADLPVEKEDPLGVRGGFLHALPVVQGRPGAELGKLRCVAEAIRSSYGLGRSRLMLGGGGGD